MPLDRLFHPRAGRSQKVAALSDLEFRVWWTYVMVADDYGIARASAIVFQAANESLEQRSARVIERAIHRLISIGLVVSFEHQGRLFLCQLDWQDFQHVKYPRETNNPAPPFEIQARFSKETQVLFDARLPSLPGEFVSSERRLSTALAQSIRAQFNPDHVETEYRIGNSYCDVLAQFGDVVWVFEVKKGELTAAAIAQIERYREALREQWPNKIIAGALVGRSIGQISKEAEEHGLTVLLHDPSLHCSVAVKCRAWQFPVSFSLVNRELPEKAHRAREEATATANGKRHTANGNGNGAELFERFWNAYPRKVGKDAALREFVKLAPDNDLLDRILAAIHEQRASAQWLRDAGRFIPHPRTWLHQGRWTDEIPSPPTQRINHSWCPHSPPCERTAECTRRTLNEARRLRGEPELPV